MAFAILRTDKLTSPAACGGLNAHLERTMEVPNADPELARLNRRRVGTGDLWGDIRRRLSAAGIEKTRSNAVYGVEFLMTASPEAFPFRKITGADGRPTVVGPVKLLHEFEERCGAFLIDKFGKENVVNFTLHVDERTPHIHAVVVPIVEGKKGKKLSARDMIGGDRNRLAVLQDEFARYMQPLGLERGIKQSKARHVAVKEYYAIAEETAKKGVSKPFSPQLEPVAMQLDIPEATAYERAANMPGYYDRVRQQLKTDVERLMAAERERIASQYRSSLSEAEKRLKSNAFAESATLLKERGNRRSDVNTRKLAALTKLIDQIGFQLKFSPDGSTVDMTKKSEKPEKQAPELKKRGPRL